MKLMKSSRSACDQTSAAYRIKTGVSATVRIAVMIRHCRINCKRDHNGPACGLTLEVTGAQETGAAKTRTHLCVRVDQPVRQGALPRVNGARILARALK